MKDSSRKNLRAAKQVEHNLPNVPEEIILKILSRLPLKSLTRFMSVSKQWYFYVKSKSVQSKTQEQKVLVVEKSFFGHTTSFSHYSSDQEDCVERVCRPSENSLSHREIKIFGSCNGLLLLRLKEDLFLWNPLTRYCKKVLSYERLGFCGYDIIASGLCYDSSTDDYKAVLSISNSSLTPGWGCELNVVGSVRNNCWTDFDLPYDVVYSKCSNPLVNEHLHWTAYVERYSGQLIIYFNPQENKFNDLPMPYPKNRKGDFIVGLGILKGCLCMVHLDYADNYEANVEVLIMKENGKGESWAIMFILSNLTGIRHHEFVPLGSTKNGETLMKINTDKGEEIIRAYNPKQNSHRDIIIPKIMNQAISIDVIVYEESLVAPTSYSWEPGCGKVNCR